jgi:hypothetical protein
LSPADFASELLIPLQFCVLLSNAYYCCYANICCCYYENPDGTRYSPIADSSLDPDDRFYGSYVNCCYCYIWWLYPCMAMLLGDSS